jgi:uncharacterized membrane protein
MGPIDIPETSVSNHRTSRNNVEDGRIQFNRGGSLRSRVINFLCVVFGSELIMRSVLNILLRWKFVNVFIPRTRDRGFNYCR